MSAVRKPRARQGLLGLASALLGRESEIVYGVEARAMIEGRTVLVTGAGGSIGSELVRQVRTLAPTHLYLVDHDEGALHALQLELTGHGLLTDPHVVLADVRNGSTMHRLMRKLRPDVVFHAAAHKHLPLLERFPSEAVKANVAGTHNVVAAATAAGAGLVVNVSTDKAADPTSVLGATKKIAEEVAAAYSSLQTRVASVRFGNVLGSRGSFLQSLDYQVTAGLPITITDPAVTRYFMTIPEAAALVIEAAVLARAGETYVLDMGEPVAIVDLVQRYLATTGTDAEIVFTGLRPGEKLREKLVDNSVEVVSTTAHPRITRIDRSHDGLPDILDEVVALCENATTIDPDEVLDQLWTLADGISTPAPVLAVA
ncbi:polysaccharide biosynthesis protein [Actinomycetospora atypica]|uniref:Polysaccharide biosynthesis protein n=1 Tax=Actinomycetospora atypica TaxID=1290095 RepID=A0ABV9YM42_9PSEU